MSVQICSKYSRILHSVDTGVDACIGKAVCANTLHYHRQWLNCWTHHAVWWYWFRIWCSNFCWHLSFQCGSSGNPYAHKIHDCLQVTSLDACPDCCFSSFPYLGDFKQRLTSMGSRFNSSEISDHKASFLCLSWNLSCCLSNISG